jgi:hypothetical protein
LINKYLLLFRIPYPHSNRNKDYQYKLCSQLKQFFPEASKQYDDIKEKIDFGLTELNFGRQLIVNLDDCNHELINYCGHPDHLLPLKKIGSCKDYVKKEAPLSLEIEEDF